MKKLRKFLYSQWIKLNPSKFPRQQVWELKRWWLSRTDIDYIYERLHGACVKRPDGEWSSLKLPGVYTPNVIPEVPWFMQKPKAAENLEQLIRVMCRAKPGDPCLEQDRIIANLIAVQSSVALLNPEWFNAQFETLAGG